MDATKLINPRNRADPDDQLIARESEHYFLDLGKFQAQILAYLNENKEHWRANVTRFSENFVKDGLHGRAVTRDIDWGIDVPLEGWEDKKLYVWFEAVMGYFTASIEWAKVVAEKDDAWKDWWYNPQAKIYNFIGKDNIPFHTIIWQAELFGVDGIYNDDDDENAYDATLQLPYDVPANEFMNIEGRQFSKSRNWAIWAPDILDRYQPDAVRYYVARTFPESADSDFSWQGFLERVNNELVAAWGNLVNRTVGFAYKRFDGAVPTYGTLTAEDQALIDKSEAAFEEIGDLLNRVKLKEALDTAMGIVRDANGFLSDKEPWKQIKESPEDAARVIYTVLRVIDNLKIVLSPFLPFSSQKVHEYLGYEGQLFGELLIKEIEEETRNHKALVYDGENAIGKWAKSDLQPGQALQKPEPLFVKLEPEIVEAERAYLGAPRDEQPIE